MSTSYHVVGFIPPDEKWQAMKAVWDACDAAGILPPDEVSTFFNHSGPDPNGVEVEVPVLEWDPSTGTHAWDVDLSQVPANVKIIRFYASY